MPYPSLDHYQSAVQNPKVAFRDPSLQCGEVGKDPLGIPEPYGGGFAYTYSFRSNGNAFAVRCFKGANQKRQQRYNAISTWMRSTPRPYWVSFDYQPTGISVGGNTYPIVKMDWAKGLSLGAYVYKHHSDAAKMRALQDQFAKLASDFEKIGCAHGDLQNGNVLVGSNGTLILIDYDGLYVPGMQQGDGDEIGIAHFQHPSRTEKLFGPRMDRFAFAVIWLSLESLSRKPDLYDRYGTSDNIIFSAADYVQWSSSAVVRELLAIKEISPLVARLGRLCEVSPDELPPLSDYLDITKPIAGKAVVAPVVSPVLVPVVDALDYNEIHRHIGGRIEVRGEITEVHYGHSSNTQREYVLISFTTRWKGPQFRVAIWNNVLPQMQLRPNDSWVGRYVSVSGLVDPEYQYKYRDSKYPRLGITIQEENQLRFINRPKPQAVVQRPSPTRNVDILRTLQTPPAPARTASVQPAKPQRTSIPQVSNPPSVTEPESSHAGAGAVTAGLVGLAVGGPVGLIIGGIAGFFIGKNIRK